MSGATALRILPSTPRDLGASRRQENFACERIFYCGSRRKTGHFDVTAIWRERTGN
jgi:hypothetical protein